MGRSEARIGVDIWDDDDFLVMSPTAKATYFFLLSQPDLAHTGVLPYRPTRWAPKIGLPIAVLGDDLAELERAHFLVIDEAEGELLVRSLLRRDKVYRQPNVLLAAADQIGLIGSAKILLALADELRRVALEDDIPSGSVECLVGMLGTLGVTDVVPVADPSPKGSRKGPRKGLAKPLLRASEDRSSYQHGVRGVVTAVSSDFPSPLSPFPFPASEIDAEPTAAEPPRPDVDQLCAQLADRIEANGSKRPTVTAKWRTAARLMLDRDGRTVDQVAKAIDWCQTDEFWRANILSMPKLRDQYDRLRLAAQRPTAPSNGNGHKPYRDPDDTSRYYGDL